MKMEVNNVYESPRIALLEILDEGVLCSSTTDNSFEGWGEGNLWG
jgi:hypothetical protein